MLQPLHGISLFLVFIGACKGLLGASPAPDEASCTPPPDRVHETAAIDICVTNPSGSCEGYMAGCIYADVTAGCVYIMCIKECDSEWVERDYACLPKQGLSYEQQTQRHGF